MNRSISEDDKMKQNYAEYIVKKKADGKTLLGKLGLAVMCLALLAAGGWVLVYMPVAIVPLMLAVGVLTWYLWRFTCVEYEYIIIGGTVEFYKVFGERQRVKIEEVKIADFERVCPYDDAKNALEGREVSAYCIAVPSENLFCILMNDGGKKRAVLLNVIKKSLDAMKYYKSSAVEYGNLK